MAAARAEASRGGEEKSAQTAEAGGPQAAGAAKPEGFKPWLPLVVALVAMPLLAYLITSFVLVPRLQKALNPSEAVASSSRESQGKAKEASGEGGATSGSPEQTAALNKILVNVAGTMGSRYLLTSLTLMGNAPDFPKLVSEKEPQLKDFASGVLMTKTIADLERPGARNLLRGELLAGFNNILGSAAVQEIYFTEFAIQ